jgi:hypothetical protein
MTTDNNSELRNRVIDLLERAVPHSANEPAIGGGRVQLTVGGDVHIHIHVPESPATSHLKDSE